MYFCVGMILYAVNITHILVRIPSNWPMVVNKTKTGVGQEDDIVEGGYMGEGKGRMVVVLLVLLDDK